MANPNTDRVIMQAMAQIGPAGTNLLAMQGQVLIQDMYRLSLGTFPAFHLSTGQQKHTVVSMQVYDGLVHIVGTYYDRWDQQPQTMDDIRASIDADLSIIMTNIQHNSSLVVGTTSHAVSIPIIELSPYEGEVDWKTCPGMVLIKRSITFTVNILPYDV
jgi:hypothetical protein